MALLYNKRSVKKALNNYVFRNSTKKVLHKEILAYKDKNQCSDGLSDYIKHQNGRELHEAVTAFRASSKSGSIEEIISQ